MCKIVIAINGAPYSGKDTAYHLLSNHLKSKGIPNINVKMTTLMDLMIPHIFSIPNDRWIELRNNPSLKDKPVPEFNDFSTRETLIYTAESYLKKFGGPLVFAKYACANCLVDNTVNIITDAGFDYEQEYVMNYVGINNYFGISLTRPNCNFNSDSRHLINFTNLKCQHASILNDGNIDDFNESLKQAINNFVENYVKYNCNVLYNSTIERK